MTDSAATAPYPDKWARESGTPTDEAFHTAIRNALARPWATGGQGSTATESKPAAAASCLTLLGVYDDS